MSYKIFTELKNEKTYYYIPHELSSFQSLDELSQYTDDNTSDAVDEILGPDFGRISGDNSTYETPRIDEVQEPKYKHCYDDNGSIINESSIISLIKQFPQTCFDNLDNATISSKKLTTFET